MPTTYINRTFRDDSDDLYDPTSVKLSDPDEGYGVKLNSDDSVIVADDTSMTKLSTGIYQYSFTSVAGSAYTIYVEVVTGGETYWYPTIVTATAGGGTTSGYMEFTPDDIITYVKTYLGGSPSDGTALAHVQAGYMSVLNALDTRHRPPRRHFWTFLEPESTVVFWATATGTMTVSTTTITDATNAPFYESMVGATLVADTSENEYTISGYTSSSVITVTADASADTGDTFTITANGYYATPSAFRGFVNKPVFAYSSSGERCGLIEESPESILARWRDSNDTGYTRYWALEPKTFVAATGQQYRFLVAPVPSEDMSAIMRIRLRLADLVSTGVRFAGADIVSLAIRDASLADAEMITGHVAGVWAGRAQESLWGAIDADLKEVSTKGTLRITAG